MLGYVNGVELSSRVAGFWWKLFGIYLIKFCERVLRDCY
jgi:hypothetical protein